MWVLNREVLGVDIVNSPRQDRVFGRCFSCVPSHTKPSSSSSLSNSGGCSAESRGERSRIDRYPPTPPRRSKMEKFRRRVMNMPPNRIVTKMTASAQLGSLSSVLTVYSTWSLKTPDVRLWDETPSENSLAMFVARDSRVRVQVVWRVRLVRKGRQNTKGKRKRPLSTRKPSGVSKSKGATRG